MMSAWISLVLFVASVVPLSAGGLLQSSNQVPCAATPRRDWLPKVFAPSAGESPIWFVDGGGGIWHGADFPIKSVWILERSVAGALRVSGRGLQSNEPLRFREGMNGPTTSSLVIETPQAHSMIPGGASAEVMRKLAFVASYVFYPSPECWELEAQLGGRRVKVVVDVRQQ